MPNTVGNYELIKKIGEGGYGKIFLGRRVIGFVPGEEVVLKQVKLPSNKQEREMCLRCVDGHDVSDGVFFARRVAAASTTSTFPFHKRTARVIRED